LHMHCMQQHYNFAFLYSKASASCTNTTREHSAETNTSKKICTLNASTICSEGFRKIQNTMVDADSADLFHKDIFVSGNEPLFQTGFLVYDNGSYLKE
jgi:hypothetical protein